LHYTIGAVSVKLVLQIAFGVALGLILIPVECVAQADDLTGKPFTNGEIAVSAVNPVLKNRTLEFEVRIQNVSKKVIKLAHRRLFPDGFDLNDGVAYVFSGYDVTENGEKSAVAQMRSTYLFAERELFLGPEEDHKFQVLVEGINLPISELVIEVSLGRRIVEGMMKFKISMDKNGLSIQPVRKPAANAEEKKEAVAPKMEDLKKKEEERQARIKPLKEEREKKLAMANEISKTLVALDKAYREAAKKAMAADKADQLEDAKKYKAESLKGYAEWKKQKTRLDNLAAEIKKLDNMIES